jgi:hypothetical protein
LQASKLFVGLCGLKAKAAGYSLCLAELAGLAGHGLYFLN